MDIVLYGRSDDPDSTAMRDYLESCGVSYELRSIDGADGRARREWEDLDGQVTPIVMIDNTRIVRGLNRTRLDDLMGLVGC